jgi:hypothetical protein
MALKIIDHGSKEYRQMVQLRIDVLRKPLGLSFTEDELAKEKGHILIGAFEEEKNVGLLYVDQTGRWFSSFTTNGRIK